MLCGCFIRFSPRLSLARLANRSSSSSTSLFSAATIEDPKKRESEFYENPPHTSKERYNRESTAHRQRSATSDTGDRPTKFQKRMLVYTGLYQKSKDIPEFVLHETMKRYNDRLRAIAIVSATLLFCALYYIPPIYIRKFVERDAAEGKTVSPLPKE